ncbi:MAG: PDR/VanB family oxidoreductase [Hydrogenophaga sp.]|uniref:PDR/VanB family oxidoreductase n=1 Tax=Hydrogenophaga sp. TaxID=1904254 RepID=UPI0027187384|nr:PDR/VanB family oxidoreductase [Hydrogenophaga sp.]MDO9570646.1 PDR/VanB family oxidoreductase [Hydrogenophaga sp.]MDP3373773.1 PDR/VanB family oxidoreductase [Hydrogenophaga sp.]
MDTPSLLRVQSMAWQTPQVLSIVLQSPDGQALPEAEPGSHVDLHLGQGLSRSYSVVGHAGSESCYEIAVAKDANSRGGSRFVHEKLRVGDLVATSAPRNLFPLHAAGRFHVLIAGGIGITPIWAMVQRLEALGTPWELHFAARSRRDAAYLNRIESLAQRSCCGRLVTHFDDENSGIPPDLGAIVNAAPPGTHFYCCGPQGMLKAYEKATASVPPDHVHLERFAAEAPTGAAAAFQVQLARSGMQLTIPPDRTILDVLLEHGINAPYGCMQGSCGMCETAVIDGTPAHGDMLLSDEEKAKNDKLLICCSRSLSPVLTLDL